MRKSIVVLLLIGGLAAEAGQLDDLEIAARNRGVRSVGEFLGLVPPFMLSHYVLMQESQSLQEASPAAPRAILYAKKADLILAFNGEPSQKGFGSVEAIEYHADTKTYEFRRFLFPEGGSVSQFTAEHNPGVCQRCHGSDTKPNWEPYNRWPGAMPSGAEPTAEDDSALQMFVTNGAHHPRYGRLDRQANLDQIRKTPGHSTPAFDLEIKLSNQRVEIVLDKLVKSLDYAKFKFVLFGTLAMCPDITTFLPTSLKWADPNELSRYRLKILADFSLLHPDHIKLLSGRHDDAGHELGARLSWLFESRGLSLGRLGYSMVTPYLIDAALIDQIYILSALSERDRDLALVSLDRLAAVSNAYQFEGLYKPSLQADLLSLCSELKAKSLARF